MRRLAVGSGLAVAKSHRMSGTESTGVLGSRLGFWVPGSTLRSGVAFPSAVRTEMASAFPVFRFI